LAREHEALPAAARELILGAAIQVRRAHAAC
jgi:hypothetical protein